MKDKKYGRDFYIGIGVIIFVWSVCMVLAFTFLFQSEL